MTVTKFVITKQAVTYIAEHVVGTGSFGVVFQVLNLYCFLSQLLHLFAVNLDLRISFPSSS